MIKDFISRDVTCCHGDVSPTVTAPHRYFVENNSLNLSQRITLNLSQRITQRITQHVAHRVTKFVAIGQSH